MPTPFDDIRRIEDLERDLAALRADVRDQPGRQPRQQGKRWQFLVETVADADDSPTYPASGDTFKVRFLDVAWDATAGLSSYTAAPRSTTWQTIAKNVPGAYLPEGTIALATFHPPPPGTTGKGKWILNDEGGNGLYRFRLTADLSNGGVNVAAKILTFDGTTYVESGDCYVTDWYALTGAPGSTRGMWQGKATMEGIGLRREKNSTSGSGLRIELDIVWMETYAWDGEVTLLEDPVFTGTAYASAWSGSAIVNKAFHQGIFPGSGAVITVYDDQCMYPFAKSGALAKITRSEYEGENPYYKVLVCQQLALTASATLSGSMCAASTATVAGFTVTSPSPFNLFPLSPTITNPEGHAGEHGDDVRLVFNKDGPVYEIWDIELHAVSVLTSLREHLSQLQGLYRTIYVERCESTNLWLNIMAMNQFAWWCSGSYYEYCSGSITSGSGSGSGATGGSCDCTTLPETLTLVFVPCGFCTDGETVTLTKSGSTYSFSGNVKGDPWEFTWECSSVGPNSLAGDVTITPPPCLNADPVSTFASGTCEPLHINFGGLSSSTISGCAECPDPAGPRTFSFAITE